MIDITMLSATVVSNFLLPYLKLGADRLLAKLSEEIGEAGAKKLTSISQNLWDSFKQLFTSEVDQPVLKHIEEHPKESQELMKSLLNQKLAQNPAIAEEMYALTNFSEDKKTVFEGAMKTITGTIHLENTVISNNSEVNITAVKLGNDS
jgi:hypothetical protein